MFDDFKKALNQVVKAGEEVKKQVEDDVKKSTGVSAKSDSNSFKLETADGTVLPNEAVAEVTEEYILGGIDGLDADDNFNIVLSKGDNFVQAAFSDQDKYLVQYKENGKQFESKELQTKEKTKELFKLFFTGKSLDGVTAWKDFE